MDYRILVPVTTTPEHVKVLVDSVRDKTKLILFNNFDDQEVEKICKRVEGEGAEVHRHPENFGVCRSWNYVLRKQITDGFDYSLIMSVSAVFDKKYPVEYFIERVHEKEQERKKWWYIVNSKVARHCFVNTRLYIEKFGLFDENFYPAYYDDTDLEYRHKIISEREDVRDMVYDFNEDFVNSIKYSMAINSDIRLLHHFQSNAERIIRYYIRKWGGQPGSEKWKHPYNNPDNDINFWEIEKGVEFVKLMGKYE